MKRNSKKLPRPWRRAMEQMEQALEETCPEDYHEMIEAFGREYFGELWERGKKVNSPQAHD